MIRDHF